MANVLNRTAAQMTAEGYTVLYGSGERFQMWTAVVGDSQLYRAFDSVANRAMQVNESGAAVLVPIALAGIISDLVGALTLSAAAKNAANLAMVNALDRL